MSPKMIRVEAKIYIEIYNNHFSINVVQSPKLLLSAFFRVYICRVSCDQIHRIGTFLFSWFQLSPDICTSKNLTWPITVIPLDQVFIKFGVKVYPKKIYNCQGVGHNLIKTVTMTMFLTKIFLFGNLQTTIFPKHIYLSLSFSQDPIKTLATVPIII